MNLFKKLTGLGGAAAPVLTKEPVPASVDLNKRVATLDRFLLQKGLRTAPTLRVALFCDISGSMDNIISRGDLQLAVSQLFPVSVKFDDDGQLDVFQFDDRCEYVGTADASNYASIVKKQRMEARGGTSYAPIVRTAVKHFFGKGSEEPVLAMIITDGDCSDAGAAERELVAAQKHGIYFHFVAVGRASFRTIKHLADALPNVGDVYLQDFGMSDDEVYRQLVSDELVQWFNKTK